MTHTEPVAVSAAIAAVLSTGIAMLALFVSGFTPEMQAATIAFGNSIIILGAAVWTRRRVTPTA
jgi:hypothetical protein